MGEDYLYESICSSSTASKYDEKIYKQIHETPMGSIISGTLAEITTQSIEKKKLRKKYKIKKLRKKLSVMPPARLGYDDDTLIVQRIVEMLKSRCSTGYFIY